MTSVWESKHIYLHLYLPPQLLCGEHEGCVPGLQPALPLPAHSTPSHTPSLTPHHTVTPPPRLPGLLLSGFLSSPLSHLTLLLNFRILCWGEGEERVRRGGERRGRMQEERWQQAWQRVTCSLLLWSSSINLAFLSASRALRLSCAASSLAASSSFFLCRSSALSASRASCPWREGAKRKGEERERREMGELLCMYLNRTNLMSLENLDLPVLSLQCVDEGNLTHLPQERAW